MNKFFIYARKSTDEANKQIRSIDDQLHELRSLAAKENFQIVHEYIESQTAKVPGRPIFNAMIDRIEKGEADGILAWHPDRLARNSVDGGRIIYLLDTGKLCAPDSGASITISSNGQSLVTATERITRGYLRPLA